MNQPRLESQKEIINLTNIIDALEIDLAAMTDEKDRLKNELQQVSEENAIIEAHYVRIHGMLFRLFDLYYDLQPTKKKTAEQIEERKQRHEDNKRMYHIVSSLLKGRR